MVQEDRMFRIYQSWSNMVQNQTKKCPNGSGITRSPGLVLLKFQKKINNIIKLLLLNLSLSTFSPMHYRIRVNYSLLESKARNCQNRLALISDVLQFWSPKRSINKIQKKNNGKGGPCRACVISILILLLRVMQHAEPISYNYQRSFVLINQCNNRHRLKLVE